MVSASELSTLIGLGDLAFRDPLVITRNGTLIDGYARIQLARLQGKITLPCIEYEMTEEEALHWILQRHRGSNGLNDFTRILLALELEPWLREKALLNQRAGGQDKGLSKLTEARRVNVRSEIAQAAGVCEGNVTMVKQLVTVTHPDILEALRRGEIRIHRAWKWSKQSPEKQAEALRFYRSKKGINKAIRDLISHQNLKCKTTVFDLASLVHRLSALDPAGLGPVGVLVIKVTGKMVYLSEEMAEALKLRG